MKALIFREGTVVIQCTSRDAILTNHIDAFRDEV